MAITIHKGSMSGCSDGAVDTCKRVISTVIPIEIASDPILGTAEEVFYGAYEAGFYGHHLTILDIGANVGAFALWANLRWPQSRIYSYEPHPQTFQTLCNNLAPLENIECINAAVYPKPATLLARYPNDGEASLREHAERLFANTDRLKAVQIEVIHPSLLPRADIVKIDTEGSELEIIGHLDLREASLILVEYHTLQDRAEIVRCLGEFSLELERRSNYSRLPNLEEYRPELAKDCCGVLALYRVGSERVWRNELPASPPAGLGRMLRDLPAAFKRSLRARLTL